MLTYIYNFGLQYILKFSKKYIKLSTGNWGVNYVLNDHILKNKGLTVSKAHNSIGNQGGIPFLTYILFKYHLKIKVFINEFSFINEKLAFAKLRGYKKWLTKRK